MTIHDFTIERLEISPINITAEDEKDIRQTISKLARGHIKGETEIDVFKKFALALEKAFGVQNSTFNPPSEDYNLYSAVV